jgi:hypothetical protein
LSILAINGGVLIGFFGRDHPFGEIGPAPTPERVGVLRLASSRSRMASRVSSSPLKPPCEVELLRQSEFGLLPVGAAIQSQICPLFGGVFVGCCN